LLETAALLIGVGYFLGRLLARDLARAFQYLQAFFSPNNFVHQSNLTNSNEKLLLGFYILDFLKFRFDDNS
jgi:hypothetical protein